MPVAGPDVQLVALTGICVERTIPRRRSWEVRDASGGLKHGSSRAKNRTPFTLRCECLLLSCAALVLLLHAPNARAESCRAAIDLDDATRSALTAAGLHYFDLIAKGDSASLRQSAILRLAADFSGIETAVKDSQSTLAGSKATARPPFLLDTEGTAPLAHAEFYCGVFGSKGQTRDSAVFYLDNLAPGKYGVVILDAPSSKGPFAVSLILQQQGSDWKLGGLYIKAAQTAGHDSDWFAARAREFQAKGQLHNAWLYSLEARFLATPLSFMDTATTDTLYDESQKLLPADFPTDGKTADLSVGNAAAPVPLPTAGTAVATAAAATYKLTALFPQAVGDDLDLVVKYEAADISDTQKIYQNNVAMIKALVTKYPELREAFTAVVARAVDPSGHDFGTLLAMKDIK
jgi:hypothetical protein